VSGGEGAKGLAGMGCKRVRAIARGCESDGRVFLDDAMPFHDIHVQASALTGAIGAAPVGQRHAGRHRLGFRVLDVRGGAPIRARDSLHTILCSRWAEPGFSLYYVQLQRWPRPRMSLAPAHSTISLQAAVLVPGNEDSGLNV
jgi:hypothetical protein